MLRTLTDALGLLERPRPHSGGRQDAPYTVRRENQPNLKPDEIMTVHSLANYLQCHPSTLYRLLKERKIPAFKVGGGWRFQRAQIDQWIQKGQAAW
jgi:excisionase family DNA binding protein